MILLTLQHHLLSIFYKDRKTVKASKSRYSLQSYLKIWSLCGVFFSVKLSVFFSSQIAFSGPKYFTHQLKVLPGVIPDSQSHSLEQPLTNAIIFQPWTLSNFSFSPNSQRLSVDSNIISFLIGWDACICLTSWEAIHSTLEIN